MDCNMDESSATLVRIHVAILAYLVYELAVFPMGLLSLMYIGVAWIQTTNDDRREPIVIEPLIYATQPE